MVASALIALLAAAAFGVGAVLQHHGANLVARRFPLHPALVRDLLRQPWWLLGAVVDLVGVGLHLLALSVGPLTVVQPVLVLSLVVGLLLQPLFGRPVRRGQLVSASVTVVGLAAFLVTLPRDPTSPTGTHWASGVVATLVLVALAYGLTRWPPARAAGLGTIAGAVLSLSAALAKAWLPLLAAGALGVLGRTWQLWAGCALGLAGVLITQVAFQAGALGPSLAALTVSQPAVGVLLGALVLDEAVLSGPTGVVQAVGLAGALTGVALLVMQTSSEAGPSDGPGP
ncbi:DMT family transporter [Pseudonocardia benzenivorans]|uniref:DMT family transporter n=1 Tax=Pseudonocardia benzenivorans TaxID=228005 RepID=A0ABW3VLG0_9PSEU